MKFGKVSQTHYNCLNYQNILPTYIVAYNKNLNFVWDSNIDGYVQWVRQRTKVCTENY